METVSQVLGIPIIPADSNEIGLRHDAVAGLLGELGGGRRPMLMINPAAAGCGAASPPTTSGGS
jgi:hypothetical protein